MPKIRGVKPDYWTDDDVVELSIPARLLFIGMWNYACDNGHLQDKSRQIKMRILPGDDVNVAELLREIEASELISRADGWITIPNLTKHQKPHKSWWTTCDKPGCVLPEGTSHAPNNRGATVAQQGRNGVATADVDVDVDGELKVTTTAIADAIPERFEEFWDTYDKRRGRKAAIAKYRLALKKPGVTADLLIRSAAEYVEWLKGDSKHPTYTKDPATWLFGEHWNDERASRSTGPKVDPNWALR